MAEKRTAFDAAQTPRSEGHAYKAPVGGTARIKDYLLVGPVSAVLRNGKLAGIDSMWFSNQPVGYFVFNNDRFRSLGFRQYGSPVPGK